jgi:hypothetical protein
MGLYDSECVIYWGEEVEFSVQLYLFISEKKLKIVTFAL